MPCPLTLSFRNLPRSGELESCARELSQRLQTQHSRISACHIVITGRSDGQGGVDGYAAKIHVSIPGAQIHAESELPSGTRHPDARAALRAAYDNAKRQLEKLKRPGTSPFGAAAESGGRS